MMNEHNVSYQTHPVSPIGAGVKGCYSSPIQTESDKKGLKYGSLTKDNVLQAMQDMSKLLDSAPVPTEDRMIDPLGLEGLLGTLAVNSVENYKKGP